MIKFLSATSKKEKGFLFLLLIMIFLVGVFTNEQGLINLRQCNSAKYAHINSLLVCDFSPKVSKEGYAKLETELRVFIDNETKKQNVTAVSVYFRDLQYGPTLSINGSADYAPASLLKLPMLITYLSLSESNPEILKQNIFFAKNMALTQEYYPPAVPLKEGTSYTVEALLESMIIYSDNNAYYLLNQYLNQLSPSTDLLKQTYLDLGIIDPKNWLDNTVNVKSYASIFTQLFNATFLDKKATSEAALSLLNKSDFDNGIKAGIPANLEVAHKFGERSNINGNIKQLHDCGIIYYPGNPYLLCVMTQGYDFNTLSATIKTVSKMVYEEFNSRELR